MSAWILLREPTLLLTMIGGHTGKPLAKSKTIHSAVMIIYNSQLEINCTLIPNETSYKQSNVKYRNLWNTNRTNLKLRLYRTCDRLPLLLLSCSDTKSGLASYLIRQWHPPWGIRYSYLPINRIAPKAPNIHLKIIHIQLGKTSFSVFLGSAMKKI